MTWWNSSTYTFKIIVWLQWLLAHTVSYQGERCYWANVILFPLRKQVFFLSRLMLWDDILVLRFCPLWCWYLSRESCICRKWSTAGLCPASSKPVEIKQTSLKANLQTYNLKCRSAILYKSLVWIKYIF